MPHDNAERVLEGAKHLSPHLGKRMAIASISGKAVIVRELMPQDRKLDTDQLDVQEATDVAAYLGAVVGKAHCRQMSSDQRKEWLAELKGKSTANLDAPRWLWKTIVSLLGIHEKAYLEHRRHHALSKAKT